MICRRHNSEQWADLQNELAVSLAQIPQEGGAENLEQAIYHIKKALEVYNREIFPEAEEWAQVQINLAHVFLTRIRGKKEKILSTRFKLFLKKI